jgi:hypothetical protein
VVLLLALLIPETALARGGGAGGSHGGGGGSSFGGGGGSSFGGGGGGGSGGFGGGGGGGLFFLPLLFGGGGGGTVGVIVVAAIVYYVYRNFVVGAARGYQPGYESQSSQPISTIAYPQEDVAGEIAAITANDPNFTEQQFLDRAQLAFFLLQKAWQDRNVDEGRAYMSPGLYMGWKLQVDQMTAQHRKNVLESLYIQGLHIVKASHDNNFDTITIRVDASAKDYDVDDQTGKKLGGDGSDTPFTEYWTFTRSAGAKTLVSGGVTEKKCPNCGAPLEVNATGECKYCGQAVTSGKFDWVLGKIDQANEWKG